MADDLDATDATNQAALLQSKLRGLASLAGVSVSWDAADSVYRVSFPSVPQQITYNDGSGLQQMTLATETLGAILLPPGLSAVAFADDDQRLVLDLTVDRDVSGGITANNLAQGLANFSYEPGREILVEGAGTRNEPWIITIRGYKTDNPVTVEYLDGLFDALALGVGTS